MGDYDDDGDGGYDGSEYGGHDQQGKRKNMEADKNSNKKRFVWPEALHRDFVAAVFDVGLKHANSRLLQEMLPSSHLITGDNLKSHLLKFRLQRDRSRDDYMSHYEMSVNGMNGGGAVPEPSRNHHQQSHHRQEGGGDSSSNVAVELARISAAERAYIAEHSIKLKQQIDSIATVIAEQSSFLQLLKSSIAKQMKLHGQLTAKMTQINPAYASSGLIDGAYLEQLQHQQHQQQQQLHQQHQHQQQLQQQQQQQQQQPLQERRMSISAPSSDGGNGGGGSVVGPSTRAEIQIMSEMRSHMDMHRQLLMRKEDQLSQHVPIQKPGQGQGPLQPSSPESVNHGGDPSAAAGASSSSSSSSSGNCPDVYCSNNQITLDNYYLIISCPNPIDTTHQLYLTNARFRFLSVLYSNYYPTRTRRQTAIIGQQADQGPLAHRPLQSRCRLPRQSQPQ